MGSEMCIRDRYVCVRARRLPRVREVAGLLCALAGMFAFATQGDLGSLAIPPEGFAWGLLSAVALAFYTLLPVRVLGKWGSLLVTGLAMLFGGAAATVAVQPWAMPVQLSGGALVAIVAIVLVGTLGAYMLYLQGVADAGPVRRACSAASSLWPPWSSRRCGCRRRCRHGTSPAAWPSWPWWCW